MAYSKATIKINYDLRNYSKMVAMRNNLTFSGYVEELLLKDLKENNNDFFKQFIECMGVDKVPDDVRYKKSLSKAIADGKEIKDINGIVIQAAKTPEEIEEHKKKYGLL